MKNATSNYTQRLTKAFPRVNFDKPPLNDTN